MYELTINLQPGAKAPLYEQIYEHIKCEIQEGHIRSGEKLPSTRALSRHLEVSRSTVELAYEQLLSEGYVEAEPYRGYFVSQIEGLYHFEKREREHTEKEQKQERAYLYDFTPNGVDLKERDLQLSPSGPRRELPSGAGDRGSGKRLSAPSPAHDHRKPPPHRS